jgi:hydrogenase maturation protein HypF
MMTTKHIHITGVVQGVGFRPYVYNLAARHGLGGWVLNSSEGVDIEISGLNENVEAFLAALPREAPALAQIDSLVVTDSASDGYIHFEIRKSETVEGRFQPISPDIALCDDCRREMFDPHDRRYRYPFINCTNCGPRFTIIKDIPYDRPKTTMADFEMCADCRREYEDPANRRFHAQPVACPKCGPRIWLVKKDQPEHMFLQQDAIEQTQRLLVAGRIVAIKGLGGFHLACDATNDKAVAELRKRKGRAEKPFALMAADLLAAESFCEITSQERALLQSPGHPIVLLRAFKETQISKHVAPGQNHLGVMLPYAPLHELLFAGDLAQNSILVMTSGNFSEEPIATENADALTRLAPLADAFLLNDRDIYIRCDDSVVRVENQRMKVGDDNLPTIQPSNLSTIHLRRSRGYAPYPVKLPGADAPSVLAAGAELKNTFCLTREGYAFLSHHIGDMENYETLKSFEQGVKHFEGLFRVKPQIIAYDLHPNYLATRYALERAERENLPAVGVQHHHAHIAACMLEHGLVGDRPVIGAAFDGTGYGTDGAIWGGEFLIADYRGFERYSHLDYIPLPGGDAATQHPYRIALSLLRYAGIAWSADIPAVAVSKPEERKAIERQIERNINAPLTSSMGRLFDAVSSLTGVRHAVNYEGQAAIEFENQAEAGEIESYPLPERYPNQVELKSLVRAIVADIETKTPVSVISARFHNTIAELVRQVCAEIRAARGLNEVALSGGVWQNMTLLQRTTERLLADNFVVYTHHIVPPNDGGLALGQAAVAIANFRNAK